MKLPFFKKKKEKESKTAVITNKSIGKSSDEPKTAFFDIKQAGEQAGNWINTVRQDLEQRFGNVELVRTKGSEESESPLKEFGRNLKQVSPMKVMNNQVKNQFKALAKDNAGQIAASLVEAGIYCAVFHQAKAGVKHITRDRKYTGPTVRYVSDVMLPNGLYGPFFGFLIRLTLPF